ncbi:MAG: sulfurtransferase complex subunit TusB [Thermoanaerobacteraceae bacterium]
MALIIIKKSPKDKISEFLLKLALPDDKVMLIQDGVIFAIDNKIKDIVNKDVRLFALKEDFNARGLSENESMIPLLDYEGWAELIETEDKIIS